MYSLCLVCLLLIINCTDGNFREWNAKRIVDDILFDGYTLKQAGVRNRIECIKICMNIDCVSIAFNKVSHECYIYHTYAQQANQTSSVAGMETFTKIVTCEDASYTPFIEISRCLKAYTGNINMSWNWKEALYQCINDGGRLLLMTPYDKVEQVLTTLPLSGGGYWTGGRTVTNVYTWLDQTPIDMNIGWAVGRPTYMSYDCCVAVRRVSHELYDVDCQTSVPGIICEQQII